mmetsp:Transcript_91112/g.235293  ORF Transcript_91112/g.235293 Transcript_91112/m.235293 type:complete len:173 (+) Transcript_91112:102-620(+)
MAKGSETRDFIKKLEARMLRYEQGLREIERNLADVADQIEQGALSVEMEQLGPMLDALAQGYQNWQQLVVVWKCVVTDHIREQQCVELRTKALTSRSCAKAQAHSSEARLSTTRPRSSTPVPWKSKYGPFTSCEPGTILDLAMCKKDVWGQKSCEDFAGSSRGQPLAQLTVW